MGNRRVIFMLLAGIAACLLLLWYAEQRDLSFAEEARISSMLVSHPLDTVDKLTLERGDLYLDLRRQRHGWEFYSPFAAQVDQGALAHLLDTIENARIQDAMRFSEMNRRELTLKDFGLAPPAARLTLQGAAWSTTLLIGTPAPKEGEVFVRDVLSEAIWSVSAEVANLLPDTVDGWRSKDLATGDRARMRLLEIKAPGKPFIRLSKETGTWRLLQPADEPADDRKVEALLDALYAGKAVQFVWPSTRNVAELVATESALKSRMEIYGLGADVALQVTVQESASAEPGRVVFGNTLDSDGGLRYVLMPGGNTVAATSNAVYEAFRCTPSDLRDTRLFFKKPQQIKRVEIATDGLLFVLTQNDAAWQMESPVAMRADHRRVTAALDQLLRLTADSLSDAAQLPKVIGELNPPVSQVELLTDSGAFRLAFTRNDTDSAFYQVTMTNNPAVYHVASSNVPPALLSGLAALGLCDKAVLSLADGAIRRVTVKRPDGTTETLQRESGTAPGWRASSEIDTDALSPFLAKASLLVVDRIEKPLAIPADTDPYGLKTPWLEITLEVDAADAIRKTIIIGNEVPGGGRYAMIRGQDITFVLQPETLAILQKPLLKAY